ncbi:MAG: hypothetical protein ACI4VM_04960, partial [Anaerovoracaceae bacterium]
LNHQERSDYFMNSKSLYQNLCRFLLSGVYVFQIENKIIINIAHSNVGNCDLLAGQGGLRSGRRGKAKK